jgi:hypothetical protein
VSGLVKAAAVAGNISPDVLAEVCTLDVMAATVLIAKG